MSRSQRRPTDERNKTRRRLNKKTEPSNKSIFRIGEAALMVGVKPYVLRFWETQFSFLRPSSAASKHRLYAPKDVDNLKMIKRLLYEERFTIEGAKKHLKAMSLAKVQEALAKDLVSRPLTSSTAANEAPAEVRQTLRAIRKDLESIYRLLEG